MPSRNRPRSLSRCGRGERLIGSGRNTKPSEQRAKCQTMPTNIDTDSSIVSLTSSTNSVRHNETKPKPEPNKDAMKDTNSMLSTDLYPTRDIEAEQVLTHCNLELEMLSKTPLRSVHFYKEVLIVKSAHDA